MDHERALIGSEDHDDLEDDALLVLPQKDEAWLAVCRPAPEAFSRTLDDME